MLIGLDRFLDAVQNSQAAGFSLVAPFRRPMRFNCQGPDHSLENRIRKNTEMRLRVERCAGRLISRCSLLGRAKSIGVDIPLWPSESAIGVEVKRKGRAEGTFPEIR